MSTESNEIDISPMLMDINKVLKEILFKEKYKD